MDHRRIEAMNIPDLYTTGRLSTEDEEAFEAHLLECRQCREQVAWADDFGDAMRTLAVDTVGEAARVATRAGFLVWLSRRPALRFALTAALLLLAALPAWLLVERSSLQAELARVQAAAAWPTLPAPRPSPVPQGPDPAMPAIRAELEQLKQERSHLASELAKEREARTTLDNQMAALLQPQANARIVSLGTVRGAADVTEIELGNASEGIVLSLDPPPCDCDTYRATLFDADGRKVWQHGGLVPSSFGTLDILVHSSSLKPGEYRIGVEGLAGGKPAQAGDVSFRAVRRD